MSRSPTIWIVLDGKGFVLNAFTVKHECASWLLTNPPESGMIIRMPDGGYAYDTRGPEKYDLMWNRIVDENFVEQ